MKFHEIISIVEGALVCGRDDPATETTCICAADITSDVLAFAEPDSVLVRGILDVKVQPGRITIETVDTGPGIPDIDRAMRLGFSTAPEWIREMGFGAGMGLTNIKKCADEMRLEAPLGARTTLEVVIYQYHLPGGSREA